MKPSTTIAIIAALALSTLSAGIAQNARPMKEARPPKDALYVVRDGKTTAEIVVAADAGTWEKQAGTDLVKYIGLMTGATPQLSSVITGKGPAIVIGKAALQADASLQKSLDAVAKKHPVLRADAIAMHRVGNRIYLAGTNDESHYFAASQLLQNWGCRWYMPTDFGECIPEKKTLWIGKLNSAYAPPFELRQYWLSWNGDATGESDFQRRNFMSTAILQGNGHALERYTSDLVTPPQTIFNISFSDPKTAEHIAQKIEATYAKGESITVAIEDGSYTNDSPGDKALQVEYDPHFLQPSMTDAMITLYNNIGKILREKYPNSKSTIGGLAYANVTMPPKIVKTIEPNVVIWLAPIDIDPNHGMDDPRATSRHEYRAMMERWAQLLGDRLVIYDYDQAMLVWRDLPDPSQHVFASDVKHYAKAGIMGVGAESRGATATTFLNLFFRGQLMWNPNADVTALQNEFYGKFYGPSAAPMANYWDAIFNAWKNTVTVEHEYPAAPAIYTPQLVSQLQKSLEQGEALAKPLMRKTNLSRNEKLYLDRMRFTRLSFNVIQNYTAMVTASAAQNDYKAAAVFGAKALAAREDLTTMNPTFTTYKNIGEGGPAWFPGDVDYMKELAGLTDGTKGTLVAQTPLNWMWKNESPVPAGWTYQGMEGGTPAESTLATQAPTGAKNWKSLRTDIYLQGQGVSNPDGQPYSGHYWYQTTVDLNANQTGDKVHLMFPGLFNEAWLYVNGELVAHRDWKEPWWYGDYKFQWDADLKGALKPGKNVIALRGWNPHHFGGIFRRPFLYTPIAR